MERRLSALALAAMILALPLIAPAWGPDRFYDSREELPLDVKACLDARLMAGEAMLTAHKNGGCLPVLTKTQEDGRRLFIFEETADGFPCVFESGALPEYQGIKPGIISGLGSVSLTYGEVACFTFNRFGDRWLLCYAYARDEFTIQAFSLVKAWHLAYINQGGQFPAYGRYTGERSLAHMTAADFPHSFADARGRLDARSLAVVLNPDPKDRLHLRTRPDKGADSLGKFYTGTPVTVLERRGDWARVRLSRLEGWMMRRFLAEGQQLNQIRPAFLEWHPGEDFPNIIHYTLPDQRSPVIPADEWGWCHNDVIIGVVGEEWLILMNDAGEVCYVPRGSYTPGNG